MAQLLSRQLSIIINTRITNILSLSNSLPSQNFSFRSTAVTASVNWPISNIATKLLYTPTHTTSLQSDARTQSSLSKPHLSICMHTTLLGWLHSHSNCCLSDLEIASKPCLLLAYDLNTNCYHSLCDIKNTQLSLRAPSPYSLLALYSTTVHSDVLTPTFITFFHHFAMLTMWT